MRSALILALAAASSLPAVGADAQEPLWDQLQSRIKSEPIGLGALFQFVADVQADRTFAGENGFAIANFRLSLGGRLDGGFDYFLQSNFGGLLDARIGFEVNPSLTIDAGRFKTPYSREFLTGAGGIDFVNRSQSVSALAPARALGVAARGPVGRSLHYSVGVFNASGGVSGNTRGDMTGVARLAWRVEGTEVAFNAARNGDRRVLDPLASDPSFQTVRTLVGVDARLTRGPWLVSGELDVARGQLGTPRSPWGGFATVGFMATAKSQLLLRMDHFETGVLDDERTLMIPGWNLWPTAATELQVNLVLPLQGFSNEVQLLINLQLAF